MIDLTVKEISERLSKDAERVCRQLLPGGKILKGEWVCGDISGSPGESLHVHLEGQYAGHWRDWASSDDDKGDLLDLWRAVKGFSLPDAVRAAKDWLGIVEPLSGKTPKRYAKAPEKPEISPLQEKGKTTAYLTGARKLNPSTLETYRIERERATIVFPCYSPAGILINRSYRALENLPNGKKNVWQDTGCAPCLFGWQAIPERAYRSRTILLCEGQIDCMTWHQWGIPALSIPNGSGQTWIDYEWENLAAFDHIYISFDMDGAGAENSEKAILRLGKVRCLLVELPKKDANECLKAGHTDEDAAQWITAARPPPLKGLVRASDLRNRLLASLGPQPEHFTLPFLRVGKEDGFFMRPGEVTLWTGVSGHGKSTFLDFLELSLLITQRSVFVASMERKAEQSLRRMMTSFFSKKPITEDVDEFLEQVGHLLVFADIIGSIKRVTLVEMMEYSHRRFGVTHFVIDSLMRIESLEEDYPAQGDFMNRLQEFAKDTGSHIHLVAHPRKITEDGKPGKMDVKGSSLIPNNADNIVSICRNYDKDQLRKNGELTPTQSASMYDTEVRIEKQRETGWEGRFLLRFDPANFAFSLFGK